VVLNLGGLPLDRTFLEARIAACQALIVAWEDALLALSITNGVQSYTIDTGQSRQVVTRSDIGSINRTIDALYNRCNILETRLNGTGVLTARPAW